MTNPSISPSGTIITQPPGTIAPPLDDKASKAESERKARFMKLIDEANKILKESDYSKPLEMNPEINILAKTDEEKALVVNTTGLFDAHNKEVENRRNEVKFKANLKQLLSDRDWDKLRELLEKRQNRTIEEEKIYRATRFENTVPITLNNGKIIHMNKFEVTNLQFKMFVESGGYKDDALWSEAGLKWRDENGITAPAFWSEGAFNADEQPVVGVSYYEAEAFARWTMKRLPTSEEWITAAGGSKWRWRISSAADRGNTREGLPDSTAAVGKYSDGASAAGCFDLAGNAMEWTLASKAGKAVCYGGSWRDILSDTPESSKCMYDPGSRSDKIGIRLVKGE
jgi:hypothetical protein